MSYDVLICQHQALAEALLAPLSLHPGQDVLLQDRGDGCSDGRYAIEHRVDVSMSGQPAPAH